LKKFDIKIKVLNENSVIPRKQHESDAGYDLHSIEDYILKPNEIYKVKTGIAIEIPKHYAGLVLPRSGLSSKYGITLINSPGLIDSGYRGELLVPLINHSKIEYKITTSERIAQLVIIEAMNIDFKSSTDLDKSDRNEKGFGSTDE